MLIISQCVKKKKYRSQKLAQQVADKASKRAGKPLRVYYCGICQNYHLTGAKSYAAQKSA